MRKQTDHDHATQRGELSQLTEGMVKIPTLLTYDLVELDLIQTQNYICLGDKRTSTLLSQRRPVRVPTFW